MVISAINILFCIACLVNSHKNMHKLSNSLFKILDYLLSVSLSEMSSGLRPLRLADSSRKKRRK